MYYQWDLHNIRLSKSPAEKGLENMQYNREKGIWYSKEEIFKNPLPIDDYEQFYLMESVRELNPYILT